MFDQLIDLDKEVQTLHSLNTHTHARTYTHTHRLTP